MESHPVRPGTASAKWSSGRSLTESQRARKREVDRLRARRTRQSALNRVAELEGQLQCALAEKPDPRPGPPNGSGPGQECAYSVPARANSGAQALGNKTCTPRSLGPGTTYHSCRGADDGGSPMLSGELAQASRLTGDQLSLIPLGSRDYGSSKNLVPRFDRLPHFQPPPNSFATISSLPLARHGDLQLGFSMPDLRTTGALQSYSEILTQIHHFREADICLDDDANQDTLIRAVIQGWGVVEAREKLCPLWAVMRGIDLLLFAKTSLTTRLVMLHTIHRMFLFKLGRVRLDELPPWYRPRPTQTMFSHDEVADFFAWPGLRERLVLCKGSFLTNDFWEAFAREFNFHWPYPSSSIYGFNVSTGRLHFSPLFQNHIRELSMWQMRQGFFLSFPELGDDIRLAEQDCAEMEALPSAAPMPTQKEQLCEQPADAGDDWLHQDFDEDLLSMGIEIPVDMSGTPAAGLDSLDLSSLLNMNPPAASRRMDLFNSHHAP